MLRSQALETFCWTYCWPGLVLKIPKTFFSPTFSGTHWTWLGYTPKPPKPSPDFHRNPIEPDLDLHQNLPEPSPETSQEPYWTWPASAPKPPRPSPDSFPEPSPEFSPGSFPEPYWTSFDSTPNAPIIFSGTFSGIFSRSLLNLTWLCIKSSRKLFRIPVEFYPALH